MKNTIKLFYWKPVTDKWDIKEGEPLLNFGDELGPEIIERLFGYRIDWASDINKAELISIGSVLQLISGDKDKTDGQMINVWGSGFIEKNDYIVQDYLEFHSVRGKLTRDCLPKKYQDIPIGDPGLLSNLAFERSDKKTNKIGVIPHMVDRDLLIIKKLEKDSRFTIINPVDRPGNVIRKITECRLILSSSLHGLIVADSFNIPNFHLKFSSNLTGGEDDYKFNDYYSATGQEYVKADIENIFDDKYLEKIIKDYKSVDNLARIQKELKKSFPYPVRKINKAELADLEAYRKEYEFRELNSNLRDRIKKRDVKIGKLKSQNATLKGEIDAYLSVRRSLKLFFGNMKRYITKK